MTDEKTTHSPTLDVYGIALHSAIAHREAYADRKLLSKEVVAAVRSLADNMEAAAMQKKKLDYQANLQEAIGLCMYAYLASKQDSKKVPELTPAELE